MTNQPKFFLCKHCNNLMHLINASGVPVVCCGETMAELIANTVDAAVEKHLPMVKAAQQCVCGCTCGSALAIEVGSVHHPMLAEHYIDFLYVQTENGGKLHRLSVGGEPTATICCCDGKPVAVYAYCNLHGMWKTDDVA
ncbi:MAG: desulfoferrodoxin [Oscillospiraceae bacterium]|nr:desulfoferrodoxin [Oscillospiraceae bacterium]